MIVSRRMLILDALAYRVRVMGWPHFLLLGPDSKAYIRNLRRLTHGIEEGGFMRRLSILTRPPLVIEKPLAVWRIDDPTPDFHAIQYRAEQRNLSPVESVTVFVGTQRLANALGGACGGRVNHHSATHDLNVTSVYLHLWRTNPALALTWQGEDIVAPSRYCQKLPDAILYDRAGEPAMAIEFIGDYPVERIRAFHDDCVSRGLPYEMY